MELLGFYVFGSGGKTLVEISVIGKIHELASHDDKHSF